MLTDRLTDMKTKLAAAALAFTFALTGCAATAPASEPEPAVAAEAPIEAADIETIDDGIAWARSLDDTATADELSEGLNQISGLVPELDIWFQANNEIGRDLISLNVDVLANPADAGTKVDDLQAIVDDIEAAIEKGNTP